MPRIYVGNLAESVTRDDMWGAVLQNRPGRRRPGDNRQGHRQVAGLRFRRKVEVEDAINAAAYFSGTELEGRKIHVDPYKPQQEPGAQKYRGERKRRAPIKRTTSNGTA